MQKHIDHIQNNMKKAVYQFYSISARYKVSTRSLPSKRGSECTIEKGPFMFLYESGIRTEAFQHGRGGKGATIAQLSDGPNISGGGPIQYKMKKSDLRSLPQLCFLFIKLMPCSDQKSITSECESLNVFFTIQLPPPWTGSSL